MTIAVDGTPLVLDPRRGVARALRARLEGWTAHAPDEPVILLAPRPRESARAFRRRLPDLLEGAGARVLYSPFSAFPKTPLPTVVTVHELPFVRLGDAAEGRWRARRHRRWLARGVDAAAGIVVPSAATRADLLTLHPQAEDRVHVIPNAFDPSPWAQAAVKTPRTADPSIVVVGTGHRAAGAWKKGIDVLFEALRVLPTVHTTLVGRLRSAPPTGVDVRPDLDDEALARRVASATCLVHPARSEGFGYPPLEAMAAGTPVVATDGGALSELVGDAALVVPAGDAAALADGVRQVLDDASLRDRLVEAGRRRITDPAFDPAAGAQRLAVLLARVEDEG